MLAFLDFEASSLEKDGYPIEVGWVSEDGRSNAFLIRPAPGWTDWSAEAEGIHGISRETLARDGVDHEHVAQVMLDELDGVDLVATAPSWDGKWLSALLRAAGHPRHALRLRDSDDAHREMAAAILVDVLPPDRLEVTVAELLERTEVRANGGRPEHRALADARAELDRHVAIREAATEIVRRG